ncbi:LLM class F420-dependent oxidoreductase [Microbispora siamensis]|uniref:LLM class F420-dependent oxidoreductase n=1 Tax=Microbispora siamensis TaxID=564413 RepID=A0ABQ4GZZ1_9ACTN|nr:LLM class F420-dependent oxidoreductase [Microbispora siamensis]GIH66869.1 LLM class F420-dependent oxidoreductase [Microbispora siamensis]
MKIGLEIGEFAWEGGPAAMGRILADVASTADEAGVALIGVGDHLWQGPHAGGPEQPELECFTTLAFLAAHTRRCRLGPVVAGVHFRQPGLLAKTVTSLDVLSGGRAMLGIGVGWYEDEARGMGVPFPPLAERFGMLEETVQVCLRMWEGEQGDERPFDGAHYRLERPLNAPQSLSRPHPPIMIGGGGEKRTLRLVARYADACNLYPGPDLPAKLDVLRGHCEAEGRDYDAIEKTCILPLTLGPDGSGTDELLGALRGIAAAGVDTVIGILSGPDPRRQVDVVAGKVIPEAAGL